MKWNQGDEVDLYQALRASVERYEGAVNRTVKLPWVKDDIHDLLTADMNDTGFHWRLDCLNKSLRPLRGGDFIVIAPSYLSTLARKAWYRSTSSPWFHFISKSVTSAAASAAAVEPRRRGRSLSGAAFQCREVRRCCQSYSQVACCQ